MLGSVVQVNSVVKDKPRTVFNLDVALNRDFFVGSQGFLVHDSNFVKPELEPFDEDRDLETSRPTRPLSRTPAPLERCV